MVSRKLRVEILIHRQKNDTTHESYGIQLRFDHEIFPSLTG